MLDPKNERVASVLEGMAVWGSFFRENIDIFATEYLGLRYLKWFQKILLVMMNRSQNAVWIAARGMGKTFLTALFICIRCILYPGTKVVIASGRRSQAINVLEKIQMELMRDSQNLKKEIDMKQTRFTGQDAKIVFKNGSTIKVVTAAESARGNRANVLVLDEQLSPDSGMGQCKSGELVIGVALAANDGYLIETISCQAIGEIRRRCNDYNIRAA